MILEYALWIGGNIIKSIKTDAKMNLKWYECVWMQGVWWNDQVY